MLDLEGVGCFTNLALEGFPVQGDEILVALCLHFSALPCFQTLQMNQTHGACALASRD